MMIVISVLAGCESTLSVVTEDVTSKWWHLRKLDVNFYLHPDEDPDAGSVRIDLDGDPDYYIDGGYWVREDESTFWVDDRYWTMSEVTLKVKEVDARGESSPCYRITYLGPMSDVACLANFDDPLKSASADTGSVE